MITPEQATDRVVEVLDDASLLKVSDAGKDWLLEWWNGTTWRGELRPDILASADGEAELAGLLDELQGAGNFLNGCGSLAARHNPEVADKVGPVELRALARYIAEKKASLGILTRFCDAVAPTAAPLEALDG